MMSLQRLHEKQQAILEAGRRMATLLEEILQDGHRHTDETLEYAITAWAVAAHCANTIESQPDGLEGLAWREMATPTPEMETQVCSSCDAVVEAWTWRSPPGVYLCVKCARMGCQAATCDRRNANAAGEVLDAM